MGASTRERNMKYARMLGLLIAAVASLMAFASSAAATTATDSAGGSPVEVGDTISMSSVGNSVIDGTVNITCKKSSGEGKVENAGSSSITFKFHWSFFSFSECGSNTVTVVSGGTVTVHFRIFPPRAKFTWGGSKITVLTHNILGTVHCIYVTEETEAGELDGSNETGGNATLTIDSAPIPRESTDFGCGSTSEWTAEYTITTPSYLAIDA
jgi:hypothetical protein